MGLALLPVGYYIAVLARHGPSEPFAILTPISVLSNVSFELMFWLTAAFVFGAVLAYLPLPTGLLKGLALAAAYVLAVVIGSILGPAHAPVKSPFRIFELLLYLSVLGVLTDLRTVGFKKWRDLANLYHLNSVRAALLYLAPLLLLLYGVGSQLASGHAKSAVQTVLTQPGTLLPPGGG